MSKKKCCTCKLKKPLTNFTKLRSSPDGLRYDCKKCTAIKSKKYQGQWAKRNPEHVRNYSRVWMRRYIAANREAYNAYHRARRAKNPERYAAYKEAYNTVRRELRKANKEEHK